MIKFGIVHYNTPKLINCLIGSINKMVSDAEIYVFDNSDKDIFINKFDNVIVFDNTKGGIIDFDKWLEGYPERFKSPGIVNNFGSAKHSYSIQKLIELIDDNFILLDSDVLLKCDVSSIIDNNVLFVSDIGLFGRYGTKRSTPYICYINVDMMKKKNLSYFNENYMYGLRVSEESDKYDTGGYLYRLGLNHGYKRITNGKYIVHYNAGSWVNDAIKKHNYKPQCSVDKWLDVNKRLWK